MAKNKKKDTKPVDKNSNEDFLQEEESSAEEIPSKSETEKEKQKRR